MDAITKHKMTPNQSKLVDRCWRDADFLQEMYVDKGLTGPEIAERGGCTFATIYYHLRKNHIRIRTRAEHWELHPPPAKPPPVKIPRVDRLLFVKPAGLSPAVWETLADKLEKQP